MNFKELSVGKGTVNEQQKKKNSLQDLTGQAQSEKSAVKEIHHQDARKRSGGQFSVIWFMQNVNEENFLVN